MRLIVNADDYGLNSSVNNAIIESFDKGLINSTTIMANMPGFDEATVLARKNNLLDKIGIHLNLSEGIPLNSNILNTKVFNSANRSDHRVFVKSLFFLTKNEKHLIFEEFAAQIMKVRNAGIQINHIDTHHHIDEVWPITRIILTILKEFDIPSMRILNNLNLSTSYYKRVYRRIINELIKFNKANYSDFLGNRFEAFSILRNELPVIKNQSLEIMVHPDFNSESIIIDRSHKQEALFEYPPDIKGILTSELSFR
jgi:chitin disaccharide deacetylase